MEIKVKPIKGKLQLSQQFIKDMEVSCPIWSHCKKQELKNKRIKL